MFTRIHALLLSSLVLTLGGCDREPSARMADPAPAAPQEATMRIGDVSIRASALQTSSLGEAIARQYGLVRDQRTVMLLVAVRKGSQGREAALPALVSATATDLLGHQQAIVFHEQRVGDLIDYIGTVDVAVPDTLRFDVRVTPQGGTASSMQFSREFYPR